MLELTAYLWVPAVDGRRAASVRSIRPIHAAPSFYLARDSRCIEKPGHSFADSSVVLEVAGRLRKSPASPASFPVAADVIGTAHLRRSSLAFPFGRGRVCLLSLNKGVRVQESVHSAPSSAAVPLASRTQRVTSPCRVPASQWSTSIAMPPIVALRAVRDIGNLAAHVPALQPVLGAATVLLEELEVRRAPVLFTRLTDLQQTAKGNNRARDALAEQVAEAVFAIDEQFKLLDNPDDMPDEVLSAIDTLNECAERRLSPHGHMLNHVAKVAHTHAQHVGATQGAPRRDADEARARRAGCADAEERQRGHTARDGHLLRTLRHRAQLGP